MVRAIQAQDSKAAEASIVSLEDERFRVTGGGLSKLGADFYLVFGQNYDNIYKGGYTGKYTESVLRFRVQLDGARLTVTDSELFKDPSGVSGPASQYHRRDLNVVQSVQPGGMLGITAYGGVFTQEGGGWGNPIHITRDSNGRTQLRQDTAFSQKMSQYECAQLSMYDPRSDTFYTTFFGGISFYSYNARGELVPSTVDNWLPFIDSITTLVRPKSGALQENTRPSDTLPRLMGTNALFVPAPGLARYGGTREVLDYSQLPTGREVKVGHIYGGIWSTAPQSGELNPTFANDTLYEVYLTRH